MYIYIRVEEFLQMELLQVATNIFLQEKNLQRVIFP